MKPYTSDAGKRQRNPRIAMTSGDSTPRGRSVALFSILFVASILAVMAMLPALLFILDPVRQTPFANEIAEPTLFVVAFSIGNTIISAIAIAIGLRLEPSVGMGAPRLRSLLAAQSDPSCHFSAAMGRSFAIGAGLATIALATGLMMRDQLPQLPDGFVFPPVWQGVLMMLGAAVREEILFRLFALNLFVWIAMKLLRKQEPTSAMVWVTNGAVSIVFALMHIVPATALLDLNGFMLGMATTFVALAGFVFGYMYWRHGLLIAALTHAISSLFIYIGVRSAIAFF